MYIYILRFLIDADYTRRCLNRVICRHKGKSGKAIVDSEHIIGLVIVFPFGDGTSI